MIAALKLISICIALAAAGAGLPLAVYYATKFISAVHSS